jgi:nitronate monooxygenase
VGTAFAFCEESGLRPDIKRQVLAMSRNRAATVFTDPVASPTGFPFKVLQLEDSISDSQIYQDRTRICDLGYLRHAFKKPDGSLGWRCPAEPVEDFLAKGGDVEATDGRKCVCNGLMANIGLGQIQRGGELEKPLVTAGDDVAHVARFLKPGATSYRAADVIEHLLREVSTPAPSDCVALECQPAASAVS